MGLTFARDAVEDIFAMTGGHPWLLRKAGSIVHKKNRKRSGALDVTAKKCSHALAGAKASFLNHIDWILTHLARIAPDEHALLRDICVQGPKVYDEDWQDREFREVFAQHLEDYGLLDFSDDLPRVAVPLVSEVFSKQASGGYGLEKRRLREAVDGLESAIRSRLLNDLQYPADIVWDETPADEDAEIDAGRMSSPEWRTQEQVVEIIIRAVDSKAKNRPKGRDELRDLGMTKGLAALLESLNWEDYILVIEKNFPSIRTKGTTAEVDDFIKELRETVVFVHLVRHNNDAELKEEISQRGFAGCMGLIMQCQSYFAD